VRAYPLLNKVVYNKKQAKHKMLNIIYRQILTCEHNVMSLLSS